MFKVIVLIVGGIFLMTFGIYLLTNMDLSKFALPFFQLSDINWKAIGFVTIVGGIAIFGSAAVASKLNR
ncbi:hypothetical protein Ngar_c29310 [Candidatus Nitrososphaera gargensis Ga9.2]|uniref:DUF3185 family protein n=1 Tax=Nitrososphaera gargensis (strain Ga9.2) TaxID=1237085 RepID=K0INR8_NITGG|nr:hypothetical protein [Candidatus Nitrososphaera gargensis]AFU59849.1 hypothetical protein Ngar_c29310 [Candidatus Nitrososphaera gargensis Ga9.2]